MRARRGPPARRDTVKPTHAGASEAAHPARRLAVACWAPPVARATRANTHAHTHKQTGNAPHPPRARASAPCKSAFAVRVACLTQPARRAVRVARLRSSPRAKSGQAAGERRTAASYSSESMTRRTMRIWGGKAGARRASERGGRGKGGAGIVFSTRNDRVRIRMLLFIARRPDLGAVGAG